MKESLCLEVFGIRVQGFRAVGIQAGVLDRGSGFWSWGFELWELGSGTAAQGIGVLNPKLMI